MEHPLGSNLRRQSHECPKEARDWLPSWYFCAPAARGLACASTRPASESNSVSLRFSCRQQCTRACTLLAAMLSHLLHRSILLVTSATMLLALGACASTKPDVPVVSSGTPERNDANPGAADNPYAPLTGAQPRKY